MDWLSRSLWRSRDRSSTSSGVRYPATTASCQPPLACRKEWHKRINQSNKMSILLPCLALYFIVLYTDSLHDISGTQRNTSSSPGTPNPQDNDADANSGKGNPDRP